MIERSKSHEVHTALIKHSFKNFEMNFGAGKSSKMLGSGNNDLSDLDDQLLNNQ